MNSVSPLVFFAAGDARRFDDQRGVHRGLEAAVLAPECMLAQVPAVVAPKYDDCVVGQAEAVELVEQLADLGVGIAHAGVIAVNQIAGRIIGERAFGRNLGIGPQFSRCVDRFIGRILRTVIGCGKLNLLAIVEVPVFLRGNKRQVRFEKSDGQEKRLVLLRQPL